MVHSGIGFAVLCSLLVERYKQIPPIRKGTQIKSIKTIKNANPIKISAKMENLAYH